MGIWTGKKKKTEKPAAKAARHLYAILKTFDFIPMRWSAT